MNAFVSFFSDMFNKISVVLGSFDLYDAAEILILSVIFFLAFGFLKGKKAGALIIGIVICSVLLLIANLFDFLVLKTILGSIFNYGTIVLIIIFQPEIREALERIGNGSLNGLMSFSDRKRKRELYYSVIENVCSAITDLSAEMTGALIVIEKTTQLSDVVQTGVPINADVTSSLIRNLFYNRAPLHDGAVVISDGKIAAAGCFLTLTRRSDIDSNLGTRHRAAIGMSESSDAIIVVVSEETGSISIAHDCTLRRNLTPDHVRAFLTENLLRTSGN